MKTNFLFIISVLITSCGGFKTPVEDQPNGDLELPEYQKVHKELNLAGNNDNINYQGLVLFWDKEARAEDVQFIINATHRNMELQAAVINKQQEINALNIDNNIEKINKDIKTAKKKITEIKSESNADIQERQQEAEISRASSILDNSLNYFDNFLKNYETSEEAKTEIRKKFDQYCDAKLWEYGLTHYPLSINYVSRPTPNILCESYYIENYFNNDSEVCKPTTNGKFKNYFQCIWEQGIFKTEYWKLVYENESRNTDNITYLKSSLPAFQDYIKSLGTVPPNLKAIAGRTGRNFKIADDKAIRVNRRYPSSIGSNGLKPWISSFGNIDGDESSSPNAQLIGEVTTNDSHRALLKAMHFLGTRDGDTYLNGSDLTFNNHNERAESSLNATGEVSDLNTQARSTLKDIFGELPLILIADKYRESIEAEETTIIQLQERKAQLQEQSESKEISELRNKITELQGETLQWLNVTKTSSLFFSDTRITLVNNKDYYEIRYKARSATNFEVIACANLGGNSMKCPEIKNSDFSSEGTLSIDNNSGLINFEFSITDPEEMGFPTFESKLPLHYTTLKSEYLKGKKIKFELLSVVIDNLNNLTGEATIEDYDEESSIYANVTLSEYFDVMQTIQK